MQKPRSRVLLSWSVLACLLVAASHAAAQPQEALFTPEAYIAHIRYLASDELAGRQPGTPGIELAADYIAARFADAGLQPAGDDGTWFQSFDVTRGKKLVDEAAALQAEGIDRVWQVRKDWIPFPFSDMADADGPLAFAGYGIEATDQNYNDYADFDAKGKILLIFRYEPLAEKEDAEFGGKTPSHYAMFVEKAKTAAKHGALALLIVNPTKRPGVTDTLPPFDEEQTHQNYDLPMVQVSRELAEALVKQGGLSDLTTLEEQLNQERKPLSADLKLNLHLKTGVKPNGLPTRNVLGLLPGDGTTTDTIVLGAHYDHLGNVPDRRNGPPEIHNGADDNASGTAAVIEMARVLAHEGGLHRNVLFCTFSAEELGLLGSAHFVAHPTIPLEHIRAMINFDMVGRLRGGRLTIFGVQTAKEFAELIKAADAPLDLPYRAARGINGDSDHFSFYRHQIPILFAFTGVHKEYHKPEDDWELIDPAGAVQVLTLFHTVVRDLADMKDGPTYQTHEAASEPEDQVIKPGIEEQKARIREDATTQPSGDAPRPDADASRPRRPTVRLGIAPDYGGPDQGVVAQSVIEGGAAKAAGMHDGDRIVRIGDEAIKDMSAYMRVLGKYKPGDTIPVVVVRGGQEITLQIVAQGSPARRERE